LKSVSSEEPEAVVSSEMPRALATAEELANRSGIPLIRQDGFQERSFGDWDTWDWPSIAAELDPLPLEELLLLFRQTANHGNKWSSGYARRLTK
jgi:broad specificity phosphatase PhoE